MFLRLPNSDQIISLVGKALDIIRLPDKADGTMRYALVIVYDIAKVYAAHV